MLVRLSALLTALGIVLGGFTPAQLEPIRVLFVDAPVYGGTSATDSTPQRAIGISCLKGTWEGASCPTEAGPIIVLDRAYFPDLAAPLLANILSHETRNLTAKTWDMDAYQFACHHHPVEECASWLAVRQ